MDRLFGQTQQTEPAKVEHKQAPRGQVGKSFTNIDLEICHYFNVNPVERDADPQLRYVNDWAKNGAEGIGEALQRIRDIELKVGQPALDETRLSRIYNYVRMYNAVTKKEKQLSEELLNEHENFKKKLNVIKTGVEEKRKQLEKQIKLVKEQERIAQRNMSFRATERTKNIRDKYSKQLAELKTLRDVYKGR